MSEAYRPCTAHVVFAFGAYVTVNEDILDQWEIEFRADALADELAVLRDHLKRLEQPDDPYLMLEGTILFVRMCGCFATMDDRDAQFEEFLAMQTYHAAKATAARYAFTFDIHGMAFARVLVEYKEDNLDLADLYGVPWNDYRVVGFSHLWVSHIDWSRLTEDDVSELESAIENDLRCDYSEEELYFWFDNGLDESYLFITFQDAENDSDTESVKAFEGNESVLTTEIAEQFLEDDDSVDLREFTTIEDSAAKILSEHECFLDLDGLASLSDAAAEHFSRQKGGLSLDGLSSLSNVASKRLSRQKGWLRLSGLTSLSAATAKILSRHEGNLFFEGLTSLSDEAAESLSNHNSFLELSGLTSLSDAAAKSLSRHHGGLCLDGLTSLSNAAIKSLRGHLER